MSETNDELAFSSNYDFGDETEAPDVEAGASESAVSGEDAAEQAAPTWTPSRDELSQMIGDTVAQQLGYFLQNQPPPGGGYEEQPEQQLEELDLYDPRNLAAFIQDSNQRAIEQALAPLMPVIQRSQAEQAEQQVDGWLQDAKTQIGGFVSEEHSDTLAAYVAHGMLPGTVDGFRAPNGDPERAIREAARYVHDYEETLMKKGEERLLARQRGLHEAQQQPVTPQSEPLPATEILTHEKGEDELAIARRIVSRVNAGIA